MTELFAPHLVAADRRRLGLGEGGRDAYLASMQAMVELVPDVAIVPQTVEILGDAVLLRTFDAGTPESGVPAEWEQLLVLHVTAGVIDRIEAYALEDEARARLRFDELARAPRGPAVDNRLIRLTTRLTWQFDHFPDPTRVTYRPDVVLDDRRAGVNAGVVAGADEVTSAIVTGTEVFGRLHVEPMAARGERLALYHWAYRQEGGFEAPGLTVIETDEEDLVVAVTSFDESDLAAAIDFLEDRHRELSADSYTLIDRIAAEGERSLNHRDFDAFGPLLAPEFTVIDHRPFGVPMDRAEYLENLRVLIEQAPDFTFFFADVRIMGNVAITVVPFFGTTPEGNRYEWSYIQVATNRDGQATAFEFFDEDQWDEAVSRFETLAAEDAPTPGPPPIGNAATRLIARASSLMWTDLEAALDHFAPDAAGAARESGPSRDLVATNREMWRDVLSSFADTYDEAHFTPLAVRGEHLALLRQEFVVDGYASPNLTVLAIDEQERIRIIETFGEDEMDRAVARLDELEHPRTPAIENLCTRMLTGSAADAAETGADHPEQFAPDCELIDRRAGVNAGEIMGGGEVGDSIFAALDVFGSFTLDPVAVRGERAALFHYSYVHDSGYEAPGYTVVEIDESSRISRICSFDDSDLVDALAELEIRHLELLGERATRTERAVAEISTLINRRDPELFESCLVPDVSIVDHLPLSFPPASRASDFTRMLERLYELAPDTVFMTAKVDVEARASLAVSEQRSTTPDGNRYTWTRVMVSRYAPDGRIEEQQYFPEDRWDDAVALFADWSA